MRAAWWSRTLLAVGLCACSSLIFADVCTHVLVPAKAAKLIVYWEGKPFADRDVHLFRIAWDRSAGWTRTTVAATFRTDGRGGFSLQGVSSGKYFLDFNPVEQYHAIVPLKLKVARSGAIRVSVRHRAMCEPYFEIKDEGST